MNNFEMKMIYEGYINYAINNFSIKNLMLLHKFVASTNIDAKGPFEKISLLDSLTLEEVKSLAEGFLNEYFSVNNILKIDLRNLDEKMKSLESCKDSIEFYDKVNSMLESISPYDLDINLTNDHAMSGELRKPLLLSQDLEAQNRKIYFSEILLGNQLNLLSVATLVHEIAHAEQEQNIGYTTDYLKKEVISIFLEKLVALKLDPSRELLKISESMRFLDTFGKYVELYYSEKNMSLQHKMDCLMYLKSMLIANKLFDMYLSEKKEKNRDKYIDDIQKVFDGKITVDDMINSRNINLIQCQDRGLLRRHS